MKKLITGVVATMSFATSMAFATLYTPVPSVNFSGSTTYQATDGVNTGTTTKSTLKTVSINTKSLIALLNASPTVTNSINYLTGLNQIPAGSYFVFDIDNDYLIVTNKNGFSFNLENYSPSYHDYGYMYAYEDVLIGSGSFSNTTYAGNEQDQSSIYFYFYDYNGNEIECYGTGALNWNYSPGNSSGQKESVTVNFQPTGYYSEVNGNDGLSKGMKVTGSGSAVCYSYLYEDAEFFYNWF